MTAIVSQGDSAAPYAFEASPGFGEWLLAQGVSLALTTYQIGKLFLVGCFDDGRVLVTERTFPRCLGVAASGATLVLAGLNDILRFENVVPPGNMLEDHDAVYVPQVSWYTGDVFAHDVGITAAKRPIFVNTLFSCLATVDEAASFSAVWKPPFISALTPHDRCHLNGVAMEDGRPFYVTAAGTGDEPGQWRENRVGGGCLIDVASSEIAVSGLTMPHSPRIHDDKVWLVNAGTGELGHVDLAAGRFEPVAFCPGFLRGLSFVGGHALVGLSLPRQNRTFSGLPLDDRLKAEGREPECTMQVIDLQSGRVVHWLRIGGLVREFYDIACLPGVRRPMLVGFAQGQINRMITRGRDTPLDRLSAHQ